MKCFFHPEREALGTCTKCGKAVCEECLQERRGRILCPTCSEAGFRPGELAAAGIFCAIAGAVGIIVGINLAAGAHANPPLHPLVRAFVEPLAAIFIISGGLAVVGGVYALKQKFWPLALAGSILSAFCFPPLGVLAVIFTVLKRNEFAR